MKTAIVYASVHHGNTKKIIDEIAKTNDVELIDATQTAEKDLSEYDLIGLHQEYTAESPISRCLSLHQSISQTIKMDFLSAHMAADLSLSQLSR